MRLKKILLGIILGGFSIISGLGGMLLNNNMEANADNKTSSLMYQLPATAFTLGGKNQTLKVHSGTFADMANGNATDGVEVNFNAGNLKEKGEEQNVSITVDLGAVYNLKHFYMYSLQRYSNSSFTYELSASTDGVDYALVTEPVVEATSEYVTCTNVERGTCTASMDISGVGRYFKLDYVNVTGGTNQWMINVYELELYGYGLSSQEYEVNSTEKKVTVGEDETVATVLSNLDVIGNATVAYCDVNGELVTDTTRKAQEGDIIKIADNIETAAAGSYDAANVSYTDEYTVIVGDIEENPSTGSQFMLEPISQSKKVATNINSESENGIENINDADPNNRWSSLSSRESVNGVYKEGPVDIMLDLEEEYVIDSIYIKWRSADRIFYYNIATSLDGGEYGEAFISFDQTMNNRFKQVMEYRVSGVTGRYIRLQLTGMQSSNYIGIFEFKVYGYKLTETEDFQVNNTERTIMMIGDNLKIDSFERAINVKGNATGEVVKGEGNTETKIEQGDIYRISTLFGTVDYVIGMAENVRFKYGEGVEETVKVLHNSYIRTIPFSGKPGKILHWYIEGTNNKWNFEKDKVVSELVLTAVWENIIYTITYESFGGSHTNVETYTVDNEITFTEAIQPFSTFLGWYTDYDEMTGEFSGEIDAISIGTTGNLTLYAKFEETSYDVVYHNTKESKNDNQAFIKFSTDSTLVDLSVDNFIFDGWYLDTAFTEKVDAITGRLLSKLIDGKLNVYAKWLSIYKISFDVNGGAPLANMEYTSKSESVILPQSEREHYTFDGWYEDSDLTQKIESISTSEEKNYRLYAKWIPKIYTITFYANGGTSVSNQTVVYNYQATQPFDPIQEGYIFGGWYLDVACSQRYDFNSAVTDNICLYAKWTKDIQNEETNGCGGILQWLPVCGILLASLGLVFIKRKSETK